MSSFFVKHTHLSLPNFPKPKAYRNSAISASLPARDRVIDFGKYKGRMLGTLPSTYLKWVSNNLRARDFEEWAQLADQVLQDPVYNDRVEWEYADKLLNGNVAALNAKSIRPVDELLELSQRFGWDNEDKAGWSRVDFQMLGTSKGGRIPRIKEGSRPPARTEGRDSGKMNDAKFSAEETRIERRERLRTRRNVRNVDENKSGFNVNEEQGRKGGTRTGASVGAGSRVDGEASVYNPFPGRETLLKKVLNRRKLT